MQKKIHPQWHDDTKVTCTCGNTFTTGSTQEEIKIDICSECHPYFTGEMKFVDRQGRVDKFKQKMKKAKQKKKADASKKQKSQDDQEEDQKSYQEILREKRAQLQQQSKSESK